MSVLTTGVGDFAAETGPDAFRRDPYPAYGRMRAECPVYRAPQGVRYVTRHADVEQALGDTRLSDDRERMTGAPIAREGRMRDLSRLTARLGRVMSNTDPPDHARLRGLVTKAFTARRVEELRERIRRLVDRPVEDALAAGPPGDPLTAVASPLPHTVVRELFGIPLRQGRPPVEAVLDRADTGFPGPRTADTLYRFHGGSPWQWPLWLGHHLFAPDADPEHASRAREAWPAEVSV